MGEFNHRRASSKRRQRRCAAYNLQVVADGTTQPNVPCRPRWLRWAHARWLRSFGHVAAHVLLPFPGVGGGHCALHPTLQTWDLWATICKFCRGSLQLASHHRLMSRNQRCHSPALLSHRRICENRLYARIFRSQYQQRQRCA